MDENKVHTKFLVTSIDDKLKFDHFALVEKLTTGSCALRVVTHELSSSTTKPVYPFLIEAYLKYGTTFWGFCSQQLFLSVLVLQKRSTGYLCLYL